MANFEDFPPIFCPTADFLPQGGVRPEFSKIFTSDKCTNTKQSRYLA